MPTWLGGRLVAATTSAPLPLALRHRAAPLPRGRSGQGQAETCRAPGPRGRDPCSSPSLWLTHVDRALTSSEEPPGCKGGSPGRPAVRPPLADGVYEVSPTLSHGTQRTLEPRWCVNCTTPFRTYCATTHSQCTIYIVAPVTAGELDSELPLLYNTIGDRIEAIEAGWLAKALDRLSVGDRVRIAHDVRPVSRSPGAGRSGARSAQVLWRRRASPAVGP